MLLLIHKAVPSAGQLVQLWDCASIVIPRRVLMRLGAARGLLSQTPADPDLVSATLAHMLTLVEQVNICCVEPDLSCR